MRDYHHFLFFVTNFTSDSVELDADESRHVIKVLRLSTGDKFLASCGDGTILTCSIEFIGKDVVRAAIIERTHIEKIIPQIHSYIGLPDRDVFEEIIMNLTAMGISQITPLITEHSQKNWWEHKWEKHQERFKGKMIAAMKQCLYPHIPILNEPQLFERVHSKLGNQTIIADICGSSLCLQKSVTQFQIDVMIGPPGGFSDKELNIFKEMKCNIVKIAKTRLRTELAAVVLCGQVIGSQIPSPQVNS